MLKYIEVPSEKLTSTQVLRAKKAKQKLAYRLRTNKAGKKILRGKADKVLTSWGIEQSNIAHINSSMGSFADISESVHVTSSDGHNRGLSDYESMIICAGQFVDSQTVRDKELIKVAYINDFNATELTSHLSKESVDRYLRFTLDRLGVLISLGKV